MLTEAEGYRPTDVGEDVSYTFQPDAPAASDHCRVSDQTLVESLVLPTVIHILHAACLGPALVKSSLLGRPSPDFLFPSARPP